MTTPERPAKPPGSSDSRQSGSRRPERNSSGNLFWYLMIGFVLAVISYSLMVRHNQGEELAFSRFKSGVIEGKYNAQNVSDLRIGPGLLTFTYTTGLGAPSLTDTAPPDGRLRRESVYVPLVGLVDEDVDQLTDLLDEAGIEWTGHEPTPEWQSALPLFIVPLLIIGFVFLLLRRMGGAGTAMSFGRSRGRLYAQEDVQVTFDSVAGIDEAVNELREVVEFLKTPEKYQAIGGRIPRGVLLVGPPGTGKTLLAKAVAGEAGVPFFSLSGSDFVEMFVGVGAARVRDMFQQAGQRAPSIIFIDELDALGKVRGSGIPGGHDEREQTLNALLVEMDGFSTDQSVIVMAATNRPETLDPALLRPGRFDRHVLVDRPDIKGREAILKVHVARIKMDDSVDLGRIARLTPGFVGADLANLVNEAALLAARRNKTSVSMAEFEEGVERVIAGLEKQTRIIHEDEKQRVAYHECGHALVACSLPNTDPVHKISIIPRGMGALGYTLQRPEDERQLVTQSELQNRICVLLGGIAAEEIIFRETSTGAQNDLQRATDIARRMVTEFGMSPRLGRVHYSESRTAPFLGVQMATGEPAHSEQTVREIDLETKRIIDEAYQITVDILTTRREVLDHMARELVECEVMDADHLHRILEEHKTRPQVKPGTFAAAESDSVANERDNGASHRADESPQADPDLPAAGTAGSA